jgi:glycosyltransferase involved in cell wall biosynthesis
LIEKKRRIVFIASITPTLVTFVVPVAESLQNHGWETIGLAHGATHVSGFDRTYELPRFRRKGIRANLEAFIAIRRILAKENPDVVHLHTPSAVFLGRIAAASLKIKSITIVHGTFLEPVTVQSFIFAMMEVPFARLSKRTVVMNRDDARFYRWLCPRGSLYQSPAGGAGVNSRISTIVQKHSNPTLLYIGRFAKDKNLDFIVDVWSIARRTVPDLKLRFVGRAVEGDQPWRPPRLDGIERFDWVDQPDIEIAASSVVVTASRREGFSMVVAEALCIGTPVVAVANRATRELKRIARTGLAIVPFRREEFSEALLAAMETSESHPRPDLLARWGTETTVSFHVTLIDDVVDVS